MSSVIPLDKNGGSGEKNAQVKILVEHLLMALRGVYKKTGIVDDPVVGSYGFHRIYIFFGFLPQTRMKG